MSEMKPDDSTALVTAGQTTSGQAPIRESAILALRPISRRDDWRSVPVRLAETYDFKLGGREGFLGAA
jgi:hypothetical protein